MLPRHAELWLPGLGRNALSRASLHLRPANVYFCMADHYEPAWRNATMPVQRERVDAWTRGYPQCAGRHVDDSGRPPQHTFFFPEEEYHPEHLDKLAALSRAGWGDVEIHLHHDRDTAEGLREKLLRFTGALFHR